MFSGKVASIRRRRCDLLDPPFIGVTCVHGTPLVRRRRRRSTHRSPEPLTTLRLKSSRQDIDEIELPDIL